MIVVLDNATKANNDAANSAIADPLPAPISDDKYRPPNKEAIPKNLRFFEIFLKNADFDVFCPSGRASST